MPWIESASPRFRARHDTRDTDEAVRVLSLLERTRSRLEELFPREAGEVTVVLHRRPIELILARPQIGFAWASTAPAARRYVAGHLGASELHVLSAPALDERASSVPGSREMLAFAAAALYARRLIAANNVDLQRAARLARPAVALRWAWLLEGSARWFCGQSDHARPAIARRLREGRPPSFPPSPRDAALLGPTVIDLVAREEGRRAAARLAGRLHRGGSRAALVKVFGGRPLVHTEGVWRSHLAQLASAV
jgi:hypothetical protein